MLTEIYVKDWLAKVFYFSLKKTGNREDAEELAADISLAVLESLSGNPPPEHFSSWLWTIASRRFARWCAKRHTERENTIYRDDMNEPADDSGIDDKLLENELYSSLRRELAFIAREHRELIVAHYINSVGISELSERLNIPRGTVKTRLMRARKILKEGMDMARQFGRRSYNPENISFVSSGSQPDGLPWKAVDRLIPKNILLEAGGNPSTPEELAMELGIALPYMEEEIKLLTNATLLKKVGNKYVTNFWIAGKETQVKIWKTERAGSKERAALMAKAIEDNYPELTELLAQTCAADDLRWYLYIMAIKRMTDDVCRDGFGYKFNRPNGGTWGFTGFELNDLIPEDNFMNDASWYGDGIKYGRYAVHRFGFTDNGSFMSSEATLLADILINGRTADSLSDAEKPVFETLTEKRFIHTDGGRIIFDIVALKPGIPDSAYSLIASHPAAKELRTMIQTLYDDIRDILRDDMDKALHDMLDYYAAMFMCDIRAMLISDEAEAGVLRVPENRTAGTYLVIEKP